MISMFVFESLKNLITDIKANVNKVKFGINGGSGTGIGWSVSDSMVINYMSAHDNNTLWDKLLLSNSIRTFSGMSETENFSPISCSYSRFSSAIQTLLLFFG